MLSQKILNVMKFSRNQVSQALNTRSLTTSARVLNEERQLSGSQIERKESDKSSSLGPQNDGGVFAILNSKFEFSPWGIKKYINEKRINYKKTMQSYCQERFDFLGPDLGVAYFLLYMGGQVKFRGSDEWFKMNPETKTVDLPNLFDPKYVLTAIDASGIELYYEALENFKNVPKVTHISLARSPYLDDWFIDKLSSMFPNLEYLDVSDCPRLSERGLEALYKTPKLKTLIVTNNYKSAAFELTCMMLEDILPELKIEIITPEEKMKPIINTNLVS